MKIVTIHLDEALLARAERLAAQRGSSVDAMIGELLTRETQSVGESPEASRARMELAEMARNSEHGMTGPWSREEAYAGRLSRFERADLRSDRQAQRPGEVADGDADPE
jgi:hypothetical protein